MLQGVGPKNAESLANLGMKTLGDMLYYFPRRYEDYSLQDNYQEGRLLRLQAQLNF